jgi:hypothetical protein
MKGSQKWLLLVMVALVASGIYPSVYIVYLGLLFFVAFAYCLGADVMRSEMIVQSKVSQTEGLECDQCGYIPHLTNVNEYWLCDDCAKIALDPHCPICGVLVEEDKRREHMKDVHIQTNTEHLNTDKTEDVA